MAKQNDLARRAKKLFLGLQTLNNTRMRQKIGALIILLAAAYSALAQDEPTRKFSRRPDIPGTFNLEVGFNSALSGPDQLNLGAFGSRTVNIYYQYDFRILNSPIFFTPGIGLSLERFKFSDEHMLGYASNDLNSIVMISPANSGLESIKKSHLVTNYIDIPLEIKFLTKPEDPARSFKIAVGGRFGYLFDSFAKVKYKENGEMKKLKNKESYNLNPIRYGLSARIGVGNISLFGYYNLSPLFEKGKGLSDNISETVSVKNDFSTMTIGISLASF